VTTHGDAVGPSATPAVADLPPTKAQSNGAPAAASARKPDKSSGTVADATTAGPSAQAAEADSGAQPEPAATTPPKPEWPPTTAATTGNVVTTKSKQPAGEQSPDEPTTPAGAAPPGTPESAPAATVPSAAAKTGKAVEPPPADEPKSADAVEADSGAPGSNPSASGPSAEPKSTADAEPAAATEPRPGTKPVGDEPTLVKEPAAGDEPTLAAKPHADTEALPTSRPAGEEPTVAVRPAGAEEPTLIDAPAEDEPTLVDETSGTDKPSAAGRPAGKDKPAAVTEPVPADGGVKDDVPVSRSRPEDLAAVLAPVPPVEPPPAVGDLAAALSKLRATIGGTTYPLVMPSAEEAKRIGAALVAQLDDYLLPRLARLDAPLLVVVGGSTGAGKSTLVNSLVRAPVTKAGVLRPTTRSPVLVSHPSDSPWFRNGDLLPGLTRTAESSTDPQTLQLVSATALGPGLAFLDAPDIDSVVDRNRQLAAQLLAAADLWLFVTTAARYADAVPWELLTTARLRGTVIALVLDRVPAEAAGEISAHLAEMLTARDMGAAPIFVLPESTLEGSGLLPEDVTRPLHDWFAQLAADSNARAAVVKQTLDGALAALGPAVAGLAEAADEQATAATALDERVTAAYRTARRTMEDGLQDGRLMRGEVLARWQEFVGTGELLRTLESRVGQLRDKIVAAVTGRPAPGRNLQAALESQLATLLRGVASDAAEQAYAAWQAHPAGVALLEPGLQKPSPDLPQRAERVIRDWQQYVLDLVRSEAGDKRVVARGAAYAVNGVGLTVMIAVFTSTAFIPTGAEVAVGAGTTVAAQKVLEAIFGDQAIRTLATRAREELIKRVNVLLDAEAARFTDRTAAVGLELQPGATLRQAAADVERSREEVALTGSPS
jgi:hypothetical protein